MDKQGISRLALNFELDQINSDIKQVYFQFYYCAAVNCAKHKYKNHCRHTTFKIINMINQKTKIRNNSELKQFINIKVKNNIFKNYSKR